MGGLRVVEPGMMTTVQDLGRFGHAAAGVPRSGAADWLSLRIGNRLLGNDEDDAALEMTLVGGCFVFENDSLVGLTGAEVRSAMIRGGRRDRAVERWRPERVQAGDKLSIGPLRGGVRSYLCIAGGVRTTPVLGSRSTLVSCGLGGVGRALRAGDRLEIGEREPGRVVCALGEEGAKRIGEVIARRTLRIVAGAQRELFSGAAADRLAGSVYRVSEQSDRGGVRLTGARIEPPGEGRGRSEGTVPGSVQIPAGGEPIVLGVDGPTTGGYPVPACVIAADLPVLGQLRPRDEVRFEWVDRTRAVGLLREMETLIGSVGPSTAVSGYGEDEQDGR